MVRFLLSLLAALCLLGAAANAETPFSFVAIGDMPYGERAAVYPKYQALIGAINSAQPAFTVHIGDIKSGSTVCSDEEFSNQLDFMNSYQSAFVYTPGDNEWTDCHRKNNGGFDPIERLAKLRTMFFPEAKSLGLKPIAFERQGDVMPDFKTYVENVRFVKNGVLFVTAHIVGSNNNFEVRDPKAVAEFMARDKANIAWIKDSFAKAVRSDAKALVLAMQADPFVLANEFTPFPTYSGFAASIGETFVPLARDFTKPVLLIHGDSHVFRIDQPFKESKKVIENIARLEVFGEDQMHAVQVSVDPDKAADIWGFRPIFNPADRPQDAQKSAARQ